MNAPAALRSAADTVEACAIGERKDRIFHLLALYIIRACGDGENAEECRILRELLDDAIGHDWGGSRIDGQQ